MNKKSFEKLFKEVTTFPSTMEPEDIESSLQTLNLVQQQRKKIRKAYQELQRKIETQNQTMYIILTGLLYADKKFFQYFKSFLNDIKNPYPQNTERHIGFHQAIAVLKNFIEQVPNSEPSSEFSDQPHDRPE